MVDPCLSAIYSTTALSDHTQNVLEPSTTISIPNFTSDSPDSFCGAFVYTATYTDTTALDTTVFTATTSPSLTLSVYTANPAKVNTYSITFSGYQGIHVSMKVSVTFNVQIVDNCPTTVFTITTNAN